MKPATKTIQPLNSFSASPLLSVLPIFMQSDEITATIIMTLSPAGQEFIFMHGRAALISKLLDECIAPADRVRTESIHWYFADPTAKLPDFVIEQSRPTLPNVIGYNTQRTKQMLYLYVPDNLAWFDGHFPDDPILPAVVQIDWVIHFGATCDIKGGLDPNHFSGLHRLKFFSVIGPNTVLRLTIDVADETLQFTLESQAGLHSQGKILFHRGGDQR